MNETFWEAQNLEIESCANPYDFLRSGHFLGAREKIPESEKNQFLGFLWFLHENMLLAESGVYTYK